MALGGKQWMMIGAAAVAGAALFLLPRTPKANTAGVAPEMSERSSAAPSTDQRVAEAAALVQSENPMAGIMALRAILQEDSNNVEAHWQLGLFSVQSGQMDKALARFEKVTALEPARAEAWLELAKAHVAMGNVPGATEAINKYKTMVTDPAALAAADAIINGNTNEKK